jgi:3-phosphoshikimate 1-carboxyvinyltransferase
MIPIALVSKEPIKFIGKNNLVKRPLDIFFEIFDMQGIDYKHERESYLPLEVKGGLKPGVFNIRGDISSQFITGLLYALPLLDNDSKIIITTEMESKGYIDLTLDMLSNFGIEIINNNYKEFIIKGNQKYLPFDYVIEGDYSQSAFFLVADMLGADITLKAMSKDSYQGDKKILSDIEEFGGNIEFVDDSLKATLNTQKNAIIDLGQSPDLGPALSVLAGLTKGNSKLINAERLRIKECDRITCVQEELNKLGMNVDETKTELIFNGVSRIKGGVVDAHNDHRVAMALAMAALKSDGDIKILGAECVSKSYPTFWDVYESLGGIISYEE